MQIAIDDQFHFDELQASDKEACLKHFRAREIYENTLRLPFPYTEEDFKTWMGIVDKATKEQGQPINWAIRNSDGFLVGGLGFDEPDLEPLPSSAYSRAIAALKLKGLTSKESNNECACVSC